MLIVEKLRIQNRTSLFLLGLLFYFIGSALTASISIFIVRGFQLLGISLIAYNYFFLIKKQKNNVAVIFVFLFFVLGVIASFRGNYSTVMQVANKIYDRMGIMLYLTPLIYFILSKQFLNYTFKMLFGMSIIFIFILLLSYNSLFTEFGFVVISQLFTFLGSSSIILLYFIRNFNIRYKFVVFASLGLLFVFSTLMARRGLVLDVGIAVFLNISGLFLLGKYSLIHKIKAISLILLLALIVWISSDYLFVTFFSNLMDKGTTDTRTFVDVMFIDDIFSDANDIVWGRGIDGVYYAPGIESSGESYRNLIETGYLHIILKCGVLFLIPFILFLLGSIYKGLSSKLYFSRQSALFLIHFLLSLYPGSPFVFAPKYVFVWIAIWIIFNSRKIELI